MTLIKSRKYCVSLCLVLFFICHCDSSTNRNTFNISEILDSLQKGYDKRVRPLYGGPSVVIEVTLYIVGISAVSEVNMDFTIDFYFRQYWRDMRLKFDADPSVNMISVSTEYLRHIWVPDTFFANEKTSYFHLATTSNEFLRIGKNGGIQRSIRLTVTASCPMNLQYFPMDRHLCALEIESFGFTTADIRYKWVDGPTAVGMDGNVILPQFQVVGYRKTSREVTLTTGNYSRLGCEIQFVRSMGYYLIQIYVPSSLIVIISWVSFWLNRGATPARVSLGVTTVLTMTTLMSSTNAALPKISYVKSIDVYLGTCFVMVFASLLEYAAVGYLAKRIQMRRSRFMAMQKAFEQRRREAAEVADRAKQTELKYNLLDCRRPFRGAQVQESMNGTRFDEDSPILMQIRPKDLNKMYGITPSDIDKYSRIIFPVCFICFNLMYWIIYLHISDVMADDLVLLDPI
ncbi:gamma-aminobutyric acid receptor subunit beta-like isoform X1 [Artemia franciscana]|uniref:gamma-aminobutyric acid receptor subunit beta-like isoform X1 n=1 Tax=Artemia franciscana TaxID=6661 RepID=UPI0032DB8F35